MDKQELEKLRKINKKLLVQYLEFHKIDRWGLAYDREITDKYSELLNYLEEEIRIQEVELL